MLKLLTLVSEIIKFRGFTNTKISNNHKLLSPFLGGNIIPIKLLSLTGEGDNLAENYVVLRDLIPINIFK